MSKTKEKKMELKYEDLKVENVRLNPDEHISILIRYAVRITHEPTGIIAQCGYEKSQHKNRGIYLEMIEIALTNIN